jgi:hypothetical protein
MVARRLRLSRVRIHEKSGDESSLAGELRDEARLDRRG